MNTVERWAAIAGIVVIVFGAGAGWNSLNNRIDKVDDKIASIQKTLGSTTCNAILTRQIEAIEKGRVEAREALEGLSAQYDCVPRRDMGTGDMNAVAVDVENLSASSADLNTQLNAVDILLNNGAAR